MTPSILNTEGFRFAVDANDHPPPHVHVFRGSGEARLALRGAADGVSLMSARNLELRRALALAREHQSLLREAWRRLHA